MSNRNQQIPHPNSRGGPRPATAAVKQNTTPIANLAVKAVQNPVSSATLAPPAVALPPVTPGGTVCKLSDVRFADMNLTGPTGRAIKEVFGFEYMTPVQAATLPDIKKGIDVLAKARTGTGKTLGFLVPQADMLTISPPKDASAIEVLVIAPTRELALQIEQEALKLYTFHKDARIVSVIGGRPMPKEVRALHGRIDVLVATPGRLLDHLKNTSGLADRLRTLRCVVFDECDQLMDMGFAKDMDAIMSYCPPKEKRQTLLFSATIPAAISQLAQKYCRTSTFKIIDCVQDEPATHKHVSQTYVSVPFSRQLPMLYVLLQSLKENKAIVFFQTARAAQLAAEMLANTPLAKSQQYFEIHSRRSQAQRTRAQQGFAETSLSTPCVLLSSDASARGVDYPGVDLVVQVGAPTDKEQYIHRLGRTARAGKQGTGVLLVDKNENWLLNQLTAKTSGIDIVQHEAAEALLDAADTVLPTVKAALQKVSVQTRSQAYQAWLGYFNSSLGKMKWNKDILITNANSYARDGMYMPSAGDKTQQWLPPALQKKTVGKMGLKGAIGLHIENERFQAAPLTFIPEVPLRKSDGKIPVLSYNSGTDISSPTPAAKASVQAHAVPAKTAAPQQPAAAKTAPAQRPATAGQRAPAAAPAPVAASAAANAQAVPPNPAVIAAQMSPAMLSSVLQQLHVKTDGMSHAEMQKQYVAMFQAQYQRYLATLQPAQASVAGAAPAATPSVPRPNTAPAHGASAAAADDESDGEEGAPGDAPRKRSRRGGRGGRRFKAKKAEQAQ